MRYVPNGQTCGNNTLQFVCGRAMRVGIDARSIGHKICGVSRVTSCLVHALSGIDQDNQYVVYIDSVDPRWNLGSNFKVRRTACSRRNLFQDIRFYTILKKDRLDVLHVLHSWLPVLIPRKTKVIVTIHDIFSVTDPEFFLKYKPFQGLFQLYFKYLTMRAVRRSDVVLTVSNYCKNEIIKIFPDAEGKSKVIYNAPGIQNGLSGSVTKETPANKGRMVDDEYLLFIGNCRSYKNVDVLIHGFHRLLGNMVGRKLKLVIAGNDPCNDIRERTNELGIAGQTLFFTNPSDEDVVSLYTHAEVFILPSRHEGFGIPAIEAMSLGTPVITSNAEALVEVVRDAALIFNRDDPEALASAVEKILMDLNLREELVAKGYKRAAKFTWGYSAKILKNMYENMIN